MSWMHETEFDDPLRQARSRDSSPASLAVGQLAVLLNHPDPPLPLLRCAKDFAKRHLLGVRQSPIPWRVSQAIYLAAIAVALVRWRVMITTLDRASLQSGLLWAVSQSWIDAPVKACLADCLMQLNDGD